MFAKTFDRVAVGGTGVDSGCDLRFVRSPDLLRSKIRAFKSFLAQFWRQALDTRSAKRWLPVRLLGLLYGPFHLSRR